MGVKNKKNADFEMSPVLAYKTSNQGTSKHRWNSHSLSMVIFPIRMYIILQPCFENDFLEFSAQNT